MEERKSLLERIGVRGIKQEKRFQRGDLSLRIDNETGEICIFTEKSSKIGKRQYAHTLKKIDGNHTIKYDYIVSPSGRAGQREYLNKDDEKRYGVILDNDILMLLFGEDFERRCFTLQELQDLEKQINERKDRAKYQYVSSIKYADSYDGLRLLEGLHLAEENSFVDSRKPIIKDDMICLENPAYSIKLDKERCLIIEGPEGVKEKIARSDYNLTRIFNGFNCVSFEGKSWKLSGFTPEALRKLVEEKEKKLDDIEQGA